MKKIMKLNVFLAVFLISAFAVLAGPVTIEDGKLNVSNNLWVNQSKFFVDSGGGNIGVGTNTPNGKLDVVGTVKSTDWSNVTITESQISDLSHTVDTDTWNSTADFSDSFAPISTISDNTSWNQSLANTLYADISVVDTDTWNSTADFADTFLDVTDNTLWLLL